MGQPPCSKTVLVVMDDDALSEIVQDVLRADGYGVLAANRGEAALEMLKHASPLPGLILLDTWKPGMPGRFVHELRQAPALAHIPVVLCTTYRRYSMPEVQGTLRMPFDLAELLLTVAEYSR